MLDTRHPFTRADAVAAGFTAKQLRGSRFRRLFQGVYIDSRVPDHPLIRAKGALLSLPPDALASHTTAAAVYGLPVPRRSEEHVTVTCATQRRQRQGVACHVGPTDRAHVVGGVRVSSPQDLFVELASMLSLVDLVVVGDAMVRLKLTLSQDLISSADQHTGRHRTLARRAAGYVRDRVDSPMETRLRMLLVLAGLPEPLVNAAIRDSDGRVLRRLDLSYPSVKVAIEYDGRHHVERREHWRQDLDRREEFDEAGWRIFVVTSEGIYRHPERTVLHIWQALRTRRLHEVPQRPHDAWRPHFAGS